MRYQRPDHTIMGVEDTAFRLNYSRRQLQRVLRKLTAEGIVKKISKGRYKLNEWEGTAIFEFQFSRNS